jgi:hypothetical protein
LTTPTGSPGNHCSAVKDKHLLSETAFVSNSCGFRRDRA